MGRTVDGRLFLTLQCVHVKTVGIIGGIGPESTIEYYRLIIAGHRARQPDGTYPSIIVNSVDLSRLIRWFGANDLEAVTNFLVGEIGRLARAGADFAVLAANTPHLVFDELSRRSSIPLISIVESTRDAAQTQGLKKLGLFGTRFTMQAKFYPDVFGRAGLEIIAPSEDEQTFIHEKYMNELVNGTILPETRERLLAIVDQLKQRHGIDGLILGGTELPLILRDPEHNGVPFLDTTTIHVDQIVARLLA